MSHQDTIPESRRVSWVNMNDAAILYACSGAYLHKFQISSHYRVRPYVRILANRHIPNYSRARCHVATGMDPWLLFVELKNRQFSTILNGP
jgi:hypothetical protein